MDITFNIDQATVLYMSLSNQILMITQLLENNMLEESTKEYWETILNESIILLDKVEKYLKSQDQAPISKPYI